MTSEDHNIIGERAGLLSDHLTLKLCSEVLCQVVPISSLVKGEGVISGGCYRYLSLNTGQTIAAL